MLCSDFGSALMSGAQKSGALELVGFETQSSPGCTYTRRSKILTHSLGFKRWGCVVLIKEFLKYLSPVGPMIKFICD